MSREESRDESPDEGSSYSNVHRAFLQAFLSRSVMTVDEIKPVLAAVMSAQDPNRPTLTNDITQPLITSTIQTINARLAPLDYEIRSTRSQSSKQLTYAFVNTTSDPLTQLATTFSAEEIAYIKRLLDCIFETNNTPSREIMAVTSIQAGQLAKVSRRPRQSQVNPDGDEVREEGHVKGIDISASEDVLKMLVDQAWFTRERVNGTTYFSLAPRGIMELRAYLKETYNEPGDADEDEEPIVRIRDCEGCGEIVTMGVRCSDAECACRFHDSCAVQYFRNLRGGKECPKCRAQWTGEDFVGVRAAEGRRSSGGGSQRMGNGRASGRVSSGRRRDEEDEDDE